MSAVNTNESSVSGSVSETTTAPRILDMKWREAVRSYEGACSKRDLEEMSRIQSYDDLSSYLKSLTTPVSKHIVPARTMLNKLKPFTDAASHFLHLLSTCPETDMVQAEIFWRNLGLLLRGAIEASAFLSSAITLLASLAGSLTPLVSLKTINPSHRLTSELLEIFTLILQHWNMILRFLRRNPKQSPANSPHWQSVCADFEKAREEIERQVKVFVEEATADVSSKWQGQATLLRDWDHMSIGDSSRGVQPAFYDDSLFPCFYIPFNRNKHFFGRESELQTIRERLTADPAKPELRTFGLHGFGGIGKTQTALKYAYSQVDEKLPVVIWLNCETGLSLGRSFQEAAQMLKLPEHTDDESSDKNRFAVLSWLRKTNVDWLVVIDNIEDLSLARKAFPVADHGAILVTTRSEPVIVDLASEGMFVDKFNEEDGAKFILEITVEDKDICAARDLSKRLDGLALALTIMATQIKLRGIKIAKFVRLYDKWNDRMRLGNETTGVFNYQHSLDTCWIAAFDYIKGNAFHSWLMLGVLSLVAPDAIPEELFDLEDEDDIPEQLEFCSEWGVETAIKPLLDAALIRRHPTKGLTVHRLIQEEFCKHLDLKQRRNCFKMASTLLHRKFPKHVNGLPLRKHWPVCKKYISHVMFLCRAWQKYKFPPEGEFNDFLNLSCSCGWYLMECGAWEEEAELMRTAMPVCEDKEGLVYAHLANSLGCTEYERAHVDASKPHMDASFNIRRRILPEDDEEIANSLNNYANMILQDFREDAAQRAYEMYQQVIAIDVTKPPDESCLVFHLPYINLGRALRIMRRYDEAIEHNEKARQYMNRQLGPENHFDGLADYQNGSVYLDQGEYEKAAVCFKRALQIFRKENELHPTTFFAEMKLAEIDMKRGKFAEAVEMLQRALVTAQLNEHNKGDKGEIARVQRKLADAYYGANDKQAGQKHHKLAEKYRAECQGRRFDELGDNDQSYCLLVFHAFW